jgi:general secretion pathway protein G
MVVLALMGLLAALVTINVRHYMVSGKQNAAKVEIRTISDALETFDTIYGRYPTNEEGLAILTQKSEKISVPLLNQMPIDPWGHPYQYNNPGQGGTPYEVISFGADGQEGGDGQDLDIVSWNLKGETKDHP